MINPLQIICGDALSELRKIDSESVQCCVTSPPYWGLRDYGVEGQLGLEKTPEEYVAKLVKIFREVRMVLRKDGTLWLNLGDSYAGGGNNSGNTKEISDKQGSNRGNRYEKKSVPTGLKPKDMVGIPWRVAFALRADGWYLRSDIIWAKPNPMPESVTDRPTKTHEYIFLLTKSANYFYDAEAIKEPISESYAADKREHGIIRQRFYPNSKYVKEGMMELQNGEFPGDRRETNRNKRSVWTVITVPYPEAHFATYPPDLIKPCILAASKVGDTVLDPFAGSGTTGMVALELGRKAILIELNPDYIELIRQRCNVTMGMAL